MAQFRSKDTKPEITVRRALHRLGYRFRLHRRDLPGTPDIVLRRHRTIILVHGCFWHQHDGCRDARMPRTRQDYWSAKFQRNSERDAKITAALTALGWRVLVIWECDARKPELASHLASVLGHAPGHAGLPSVKRPRRPDGPRATPHRPPTSRGIQRSHPRRSVPTGAD
ncbi:DNA mismatch endonuclease Vsr [Mesorhizobium sp. M0276]